MANPKTDTKKESDAAPTPATPPPKRTPRAHAELAKIAAKGPLPETMDQDAFMATFDAAKELAEAGEIHLGQGPVGIINTYEMPGRPDLAIAHGRGTGGCSFVMAVPRPPAPQPATVETKSWAEDTEAELETVETKKP